MVFGTHRSIETIPSAWLRRNVLQPCDGGRLRHAMYLAAEVWPTSMPSLRSSPWTRGAPQSGLARLISRISRRISGATLGLPACRRDFQRQKERNPARCQRITVSGSTIVSASKIRGAIRYKQTKIIRSKLLKTGRRGDARRSTFSWWRRASISASSEVFDRNSPRSIHLIRLSRARIEHSSPDSDVHAKRTEFTTATAGEGEARFAVKNMSEGKGMNRTRVRDRDPCVRARLAPGGVRALLMER